MKGERWVLSLKIYAPAKQLLMFTAYQSRFIFLCCADNEERKKHTTLQTLLSLFPLCELLFNFLFAGLCSSAIKSCDFLTPKSQTINSDKTDTTKTQTAAIGD